jgi:hypothetical protein
MLRFLALFFAASIVIMSAADLDVRRVALYKHGVGFFERAGEIPAGETAVLQFKAEEMDDVLKSLTIEQTGGQGVSAVRYDSSDPLSKRLEVFPFRLGDAMALTAVLDQFKGAEIELQMSGGALTGSVVSARQLPQTQNESGKEQLLLLIGGALRTVDPSAASSIRFTDLKIQQQFTDYLATLSRSRNTDRRTVTIESQGGASRVAAGYITPTPIWKSSYRLVFDAQNQPMLEGWAIVDNTSGEDWEGVTLSLVSGLPVSFISRLYEPRYLQRPVIQLAQDRAWTPKVHGGAIESMPEPEMAAGIVGGLGGAPAAPAMAKAMAENRAFRQDVRGQFAGAMASDEDAFRRNELTSTVAATAVKAELGDLFEYRIDHPVTIRKSESAMLPFFRERVPARRLYIYDESNGSQHPLNAAEITNSAGATLDGGAITVYDGGAYAGEALVETIKAGDKRLISYAVDLGTRITTAYDSTSKLQQEFHFRRGVMTTKTALRETKTFTIRNVDKSAKTIILEQAVRPGYELIEGKPAEKTASAYRFEVPAGADSTSKFAIVEERLYDQQLSISNMPYEQLLTWTRNKELDEAGRGKLGQIADLKRRIADAQQEEQRVNQRVQEMNEDQNRLRNNISTLRSVSGQDEKVRQYAEQLAAHESQLVEMRDRQSELRRQADELQRELNALMETMEF